ncbi:hypothetical protein NDI40_24650 [Microcoleus vaginatus ZQ-A3]
MASKGWGYINQAGQWAIAPPIFGGGQFFGRLSRCQARWQIWLHQSNWKAGHLGGWGFV